MKCWAVTGEKKANPGYTCDATESSGAILDNIGLATSGSNCSGNNTHYRNFVGTANLTVQDESYSFKAL